NEVVYPGGHKMPSQGLPLGLYLAARTFIAMADLLGILQVSGAPDGIGPVQGDLHVEIPPYPMEFPGDIGIGVPTLKIVFGQFGVPLAHGEGHTLGTVPSRPSDL